MEELLKLTRENNIMLKYIIQRLNKDNTTEDFMIDVIANLFANKIDNK